MKYQSEDPNFYISTHGKIYAPPFLRKGYITLEVLPDLKGRLWDQFSLGLVNVLRPSFLRVTKGEVTTDTQTWRVTVFIDDENRIKKIVQEVEVSLTDECAYGQHVMDKLADRPLSGLPEGSMTFVTSYDIPLKENL